MANHRAHRGAPRRDTSAAAAPVVGKRRAVREGTRSPLLRVLPSAPILLGVTALAVSAGGAVSAADPGLVGQVTHSGSPVSAAGTIGAAAGNGLLATRDALVSRDSRRDALADAADQELVEQAEAQAEQRNAALQQFAEAAEKQAAKIKENQWVLPLSSYRLTAGFGQSSYLWSSVHTGLDFSAPTGSPIHAVANGVVTSTGYDGSYGNKTVITLDDGTELWFCHQSSFLVNVGDTVRGGEIIGTVGSTGNSTGPHLHLEVRPGAGDPVDPFTALLEHGVQP